MTKFIFNFDVSKKKNQTNKIRNVVVVKEKVEGIVVEIDGVVKVDCDGKLYPLTEASHNCRGKKEVWFNERDKYGHRIKIIRAPGERVSMDWRWKPYSVGLIVYGNIVKIAFDAPKFDIKRCINPYIYD